MIDGTFYVSTNGNDSNSDTKDAPFLTVKKAVYAVAFYRRNYIG